MSVSLAAACLWICPSVGRWTLRMLQYASSAVAKESRLLSRIESSVAWSLQSRLLQPPFSISNLVAVWSLARVCCRRVGLLHGAARSCGPKQ